MKDDKSFFELLASKITEPLWNRELTDEEKADLQEYTSNPNAYILNIRLRMQNQDAARRIQ